MFLCKYYLCSEDVKLHLFKTYYTGSVFKITKGIFLICFCAISSLQDSLSRFLLYVTTFKGNLALTKVDIFSTLLLCDRSMACMAVHVGSSFVDIHSYSFVDPSWAHVIVT